MEVEVSGEKSEIMALSDRDTLFIWAMILFLFLSLLLNVIIVIGL